jgi:hypothetical protein
MVWENFHTCGSCPDFNWSSLIPEYDRTCDTDQDSETWDGSKLWTYTFRHTLGPEEDWYVEVAGHDFSHWLPTYPWKHEKWTEESWLFAEYNKLKVELCEGWNLVSVPWHLADPTPAGAFGQYGTVGYSGITKAWYYTGGQYGTWKYAALNPVSGAWGGTLTSIVPGEAYWVWCSPPEMIWKVLMEKPEPIDIPPSIPLVEGWNMVGFVDITQCLRCECSARYYFASVLDEVLQSTIWEYRNCRQGWLGTALWPMGTTCGMEAHDIPMHAGQGYWFSVPENRTLYPTVGSIHDRHP